LQNVTIEKLTPYSLCNEIGADYFEQCLTECREGFCIPKKKHAIKNPTVIATIIQKAQEQGRTSKTISKESCPVRPIPAYKAGLYGLTENRQLSNSNPKPPFIPVHRTGHSGCFSNILEKIVALKN